MKGVLTWHSIDESGSVISVTARQLERHLDWLASGLVRVVPLASLPSVPDESDAVALTFDDGFANFARIAAPMLSERGLAATVFVVPGHVGETNAWNGRAERHIPSLPLMTWEEIGSVQSAGFDIGAHGMTHRSLFNLDHDTLKSETTECADAIESRLGARPAAFAYPYGDHDDAAVAAVSAEFAVGCTTCFDFVTASNPRHELPRLDAYYFRDNNILEGWGTNRLAGYVALRAAGRSVSSAIRSARRRDA